LREENAERAAQTLREAGFECSTMAMDVSDRASVQAVADKAAELGEVRYVINSAGVSPSQAAPQTVCKVDLYGTALVLEIFGGVIAEGGAGVMIGSQSGHRLPPLAEAVGFYDDCPPDDRYSRFGLAVEMLCYEVCHTHCLRLEIKGFGMEWKGYFRYLDNIFPNIPCVLRDIRNCRPTDLHFYSAGRRMVFIPLNKQTYRLRIDDSREANPAAETIAAGCLHDALEQAAAVFFRFAKTAYPLVFVQYLLPYLNEAEPELACQVC